MIRTARRERERSGRVAGANRGSARAAHADAEYDVEIDTTDGQLAALAQELHSKYLACPHPEAFGRLRKRLLS
jgi:chloramphenicol 3-O phosphotransferase